MRFRRLAGIAAAIALSVTGLATTAAPAEAAPKGVPDNYYRIMTEWAGDPSYYANNANLWVAPTAQLKRGGLAVTWDVAFICPKGKKYTLDGALGDLNPASVPPLQDGDGWIPALLKKPLTGTCTGKVQLTKLQLITQRVSWGDIMWDGTFYPAGSGLFPLVPGTAETALNISGSGFYALYAANVGADFTGEGYVRFV